MNKSNLLPRDGATPCRCISIAMLFCGVLAGCSGGGGSDAPAQAVAAASAPASTPTASTPLIDNEDLTAGIKGVDANGNGIRDDIDRLIAKKYAGTSPLKKAAEQTARALQKSMEATTRDQALAAGDQLMRSGACVYKTLAHGTDQQVKFRQSLSIEIEALTANTRKRFKAYWAGEKLGGGAVYEQAREPVCD